MTQLPPTYPGPLHTGSREAPGATAGMVLGIISIVFNAPIVGLILAWIGFTKSRDAKAMCEMNPGQYTNAGVAQAGYILCIIGLCLGGLSTLCGCGYFIIIGIALVGGAASGM
jgi:hypothetical protein